MAMALKYPPAAQALIDGVRLPDLRWLGASERCDMADLLRYLRNDLAATFAQAQIRKDPKRAWTGRDRESTFGIAHDDAERMMVNWFLERADQPGLAYPTFDEADRALQAVRERPAPGAHEGAQRFTKMDKGRRQGYGIPDDYFTAPSVLEHLARLVGLPSGYLLLELRMTSGLSGNTRVDLPIRSWLKDRIEFALRSEGVTPHRDDVSVAAATITPPPAVAPKPVDAGRGDVVRRLDALRVTLGSMTKVYDLAGGAQSFEELVGVKTRTVESWIWEKKRPRPGSAQKLAAFLDTVEPLVAEHALRNDVVLQEIAAQQLGITRPLFETVVVATNVPPAARDFSCGCDGRGL